MTADLFTLGLEVKSDGVANASDRLNTLSTAGKNAEAGTSSLSAAFDKLGYSLSNLQDLIMKAASAFALMKLAEGARDVTMFAANVEQANRALSVIANTMGMTSEKAMKYRDALRDIGISTNSATNSTAQFIKSGFPLEALNKLGTAAQGAAISYQMMSGEAISSSTALDKMIRALVTGNAAELHTLGINVMMRDSLMANKRATGEAAMEVDGHQRKLLMLNDVLKNTEPLMLLYAKSTDLAAKQISSSKRPMEELKLAMGNLFLPELTTSATLFYQTLVVGMKWVRAHTDELTAVKLVIKDFATGLLFAVSVLTAYSVVMALATSVTGGFTAGAGMFTGVLAALRMNLSLTAASADTASIGVLSLKAAFSVLGAAMLGWEIGKFWASFESGQKAGILIVHGLIKTWDLASEAYERFVATVNPFGNEEQQQIQLAKITAKYAAIKKTRDDAFAGSWSEVGKPSDPTTKPYVNDKSAIAAGIKRENERLAAEAAAKASQATMQDDEEYSRALKKSADEYAKYLEAVDKRIEAADKNSMELRLANATSLKDQMLMGERTYAELVLQEKLKLANQVKTIEDAQYVNAQANLALIMASVKTMSDGTVAEGHLGGKTDGRLVGQYDVNVARVEVEKTRIAKENAETKSKLTQEEIAGLGEKYKVIDALAIRELEIQKQELYGATKETQAARDTIKYDKLLLDSRNEKLVRIAKELDLITRLKAQEDARRNAANTVQDINTATTGIGISMIDDPAARKAAELQASYDTTMVNIQRQQDAITAGNDAQIQAITNLEERKQAAFDKDIALTNQLAAKKAELDKNLAGVKQEDTASHWDTTLASAKKVAPQLAALDGFVAIQHKKYEEDATDATKLSTKGKLDMTSDYVGAAGSMFTSLASTMDTSSRDGFESAKAFSIAAAVMDTASAIMKAYSLGPIAGTVAAVGIAAIGAIQIAKIASTSYKGGASAPSAPAGSFSGSSTGAGAPGQSIGNAFVSVQDSQTYDSMKRLADASDNASLALTKVADGLTNISTMFSAGSVSGGIASKTPGFGTAVNDTGAGLMSQWKDFNMGFVKGVAAGTVIGGAAGGYLGAVIGSAIGSVVGPLMSAFGHGPWQRQYGGIALNMEGGQINNGQTWSQYQSNGGLFTGNKTKIAVDGQVDPQYINALNGQVLRLQSTIARAAVIMGTTVDFANAQNVGMTLMTSGKTAEEINKELVAYFERIAGSLAQTTAGLKDYTFYGESAYDATIRLATALQSTNESMKLLGATLVSSTLEGANFTYKLQDMMGGAEKFATAVSGYFTGMYSKDEQAARNSTAAQAKYTAAFAAMNDVFTNDAEITIPKTKAAYISLVNSFVASFNDATTFYTKANGDVATAGERAAAFFAALMGVSDSFVTVAEKTDVYNQSLADSIKDLDIRALRVQGLTGEASMLELVNQQEVELTAYLNKGLDTGRLRIVQEKEYQATLRDSIKNMGTIMTNLDGFIMGQRSVLTAVKNMKANDPSTTPEQKLITAKAAYEALRGKATAIIAPLVTNATADQITTYNDSVKKRNTALGDLGGASQDYLSAASNVYGTTGDYQEILTQLIREMSTIGGMTDANPTIDALNEQIDWLDSIHTAITDGDTKALDKLLNGSNSSLRTNVLLGDYLMEIQKITTSYLDAKGKSDKTTQALHDIDIARPKADTSLGLLTASDTKGRTAQQSVDKLGGSVTVEGSIAWLQEQVRLKQKSADSSYALVPYAGSYAGAFLQAGNNDTAEVTRLNGMIKTANEQLVTARQAVLDANAAHAGLYSTSQADALDVRRLINLLANLGVAGYESDGTPAAPNAPTIPPIAGVLGPISQNMLDAVLGTIPNTLHWTMADVMKNPSYAVGSSYIPSDMTANIHQAEMIIDRQSADVLRKYGIQVNGSADNREVVAELKELNVKSAAMERRLANIEVKARLVANSPMAANS